MVRPLNRSKETSLWVRGMVGVIQDFGFGIVGVGPGFVSELERLEAFVFFYAQFLEFARRLLQFLVECFHFVK